jgi:hypothetical protein
MKQITVCNAASGGTMIDRTVAPGTTAADVLRDINLPNGLLSRGEHGEIFANSDYIYDHIKEGEKLFASAPAQVGSSFFETVINKALERFDLSRPQAATSNWGGALRRPSLVPRQQIPYWQEHGWKRQGTSFVGKFVTPYGAYTGWISQANPTEIEFYIRHPPSCIFHSSHAACFRPRGTDNWFLVHMSSRVKDISSGILTIEQLINECFKGRA